MPHSHGRGATLIPWTGPSADDPGCWNLPPGELALLVADPTPIQRGQPFGDGLSCITGALHRGARRADAHGFATWSVAAPTGGTYQVLYRDANGPCGTGMNASNGRRRP